MRLAYFSPLSPIRSGISAYSEELLPYLAKWADIDLFVDDFVPTHPEIIQHFPIYPQTAFGAHRLGYDLAIYHLGNHYCHAGIYRTFLEYPGLIVLHDFNLYGLVGWMTREQGNQAGYMREMAFSEGASGARRAWRIVKGYETVNPDEHPLNQRALDLSLGVVVHSNYARRLVQSVSPYARVTTVRMGVPASPPPVDEARIQARDRLGLARDDLLVASFGLMTPEKRIKQALRAFAGLLEEHPRARYALVGEVAPGYDIDGTIQELDLAQRVIFTGYVSFDEFEAYMSASDVAVNLRYPTAGETSASVLRLLGTGLPTIVSDVGWFSELPDDCCRKVAPGAGEESELMTCLLELTGDSALRRHLGQQAWSYVREHHSLEGAARAYHACLEAVYKALR